MSCSRLGVGVVVLATSGAAATAGGPTIELFTEEAAARGFVYKQTDYSFPGGVAYGHQGYGVGFVDLDGDRDLDIVALGGGDALPESRLVGIFENDGTGHFIDRTPTSGIPPQLQMVGFGPGDYDGDGDVDLYIANLGIPNTLLRNDGGFTFTDVTDEAGVGGGIGDSNGAHFGDFNGDGWLDLYVANYNGISGVPGSDEVDNILYQNNGDGTFTDVSVEQGVDSAGLTFIGTWFDYDRDGDVDLYLSNDRGHLNPPSGVGQPNELYRNDNGQMVDVSEGSGADVGLFSMGVACGDFDGNGYPDLYCTNLAAYEDGFNPLLLNQGDGTFVESSFEAGVEQFVSSWGAVFWDFDNDADHDLYVNNMFDPNMLHLQPDAFPCIEVAGQCNVQSGFGFADGKGFVSFTSAVGDVDADGDLDLLVGTTSQNVELFINNEGDQRNSVRLDVVGLWPNVHAIGGNVEITDAGVSQFHEIFSSGNGYLGQNETTVHFGVDAETAVDQAVVSWPGGEVVRTLTDVPAGTAWLVYPPSLLGDADRDGEVALDDFVALQACFGAPVAPGCEVMDFTGDFQIDAADIDGFLGAFDGAIADCDNDGTPDLEQILLFGGDDDADGVLDVCQTPSCPADLSGDGAVGSQDLNIVLASFGCTGGGCAGDVDADGDADSADLNALLAAFGDACP